MEFPSSKKISLKTNSPVHLTWEYSEPETLPSKMCPTVIAEHEIDLKEAKKSKAEAHVKLLVRTYLFCLALSPSLCVVK